MIYFKTIPLTNPDKAQVEKAIRKLALRRDSWIDMVGTGTNVGTDKLFVGTEGKRDTKFTRIRYSVADYMPKLIISLPNADDKQFYRLRLSFKSFVIFCFMVTMLLMMLVLAFLNANAISLIPFFLVFNGIFFLLILLEIRLIKKSINTAVIQLLQAQS